MEGIESGPNFPMTGKVEGDETYEGGQDDQAIGETKVKK